MSERRPSPCSSIEPLVTPFIDGELAAAERELVQEHLRDCPPCCSRVNAEQAVHRLVSARKESLHGERAPAALRVKCQSLVSQASTPADPSWAVSSWPSALAPLALVATLVLIVGGAFVYQLTARSGRVMAAELTVDHMKCFAMNSLLGTHQATAAVESSMASGFGWEAHLPENTGREGLELVGSRPCLYGEGRVAHVMYRHNGHPVSLFMLPGRKRPDEVINILGHDATVWSVGDRTFVLVTREERSELARLASFVRASLH